MWMHLHLKKMCFVLASVSPHQANLNVRIMYKVETVLLSEEGRIFANGKGQGQGWRQGKGQGKGKGKKKGQGKRKGQRKGKGQGKGKGKGKQADISCPLATLATLLCLAIDVLHDFDLPCHEAQVK